MKVTPFAPGRRWRSASDRNRSYCRTFEFVIVGKATPEQDDRKNAMLCRLVCLSKDDHGELPFCCDGLEGTYTQAHLKKYARLVEIAP